ncbi:MAG: hypothetical protein QOC99_443 [Acidobacteriota bacterium]|nr:hypothetical protein [Acidobacteriota bacterium]
MPEASFNPFPGLRPFEPDETYLFFGRDGQSEELIRRLKRTRFLAVVGTSGSGKSSLVRAGLLPALQGGMMTSAGSDWRIATLRPGDNPIGNLAAALSAPEVLGSADPDEAAIQAAFTQASLRRSSLGLLDVVRQAREGLDAGASAPLLDYENLLILVDQFEEIFRFRQLIEVENSKEDAAAFVRLLLEAVRQPGQRLYVVLTMRSDFLGDCSQFQGLPEVINDGQYLIPRMTRDERRVAITGPVAIGHGAMTEPLVNQLLNDMGDNPDQLPILQHALMRTWDFWQSSRRDGEPIDLPHYKAIGGMSQALSLHAEEAFGELSPPQRLIAEKLFKGLTELGTDNRETRRPLELREVCALTQASEAEVISVVEVFRRPGRSFLMPPASVPLDGESLLDISHESLIRNWSRLAEWVEEEALSSRMYRRLAETAELYAKKEAGLWRDPDLQLALDWLKQTEPNETWARRYDPDFDAAMAFLAASEKNRGDEAAERERQRKEKERFLRGGLTILSLLLVLMLGATAYAWRQSNVATQQTQEAHRQTLIAQDALLKVKEQKDAAERATAEAKKQRAEAERQKAVADEQKNIAKGALKETVGERDKAKKAQAEALEQRNKALAASREAVHQRDEARKEKKTAQDALDQVKLKEEEAQRQKGVAEGAMATAKLAEVDALKAKTDAEQTLKLVEEIDSSVPYYKAILRGHNEAVVRAFWDDSYNNTVMAAGADGSVLPLRMQRTTGRRYRIDIPTTPPPDNRAALPNAAFGKAVLSKYAVYYAPPKSLISLFVSVKDSGKDAEVWDAQTKQKKFELKGHTGQINSIAFAADGQMIVTASDDDTARVWDASNGKSLQVLQGHLTEVNSAVFSHDGALVLTASDDGTARLWDAKTGESKAELKGHTAAVNKAVFSPDDKLILTVSKDRTARLWRTGEEKAFQVLEGHTDEVNDAVFGDVVRRVVTASQDRTAIVWQPVAEQGGEKWKSVAVLRGHIRPLTGLDISKGSNYVVTASEDRTARVWDLSSLSGFRVASIKLASEQAKYEGTCPVPLKYTGSISTKGGSGTVKYRFVLDNGPASPEQELYFDTEGEKEVSWTWDYAPDTQLASGSAKLEIIEPKATVPNESAQWQNVAAYNVNCLNSRSKISDEQLRQIMPNLPREKRARFLDPLQRAMLEFGIDTPLRQAAFLAAIAFESSELNTLSEFASGAAYEGRRDLGNTEPGDGQRFKGRSPFQITGRHNYHVYGELLGVDLIAEPEKAEAPDVTFRIAALFWQKGGGNDYADLVEGPEDFTLLIRKALKVSPTMAAKSERYQYFKKARQVLLKPQPSDDAEKLAAIPQTSADFFGINILKANVNGTGTNSATVAPGTIVPVTVSYTIVDKGCPGCIDQIQIGLMTLKAPAGCVYNGQPGVAGETGRGTVYVTAPAEPGIYYIGFGRSQGNSCLTDRWWNEWKDDPPGSNRQRYIGLLQVK